MAPDGEYSYLLSAGNFILDCDEAQQTSGSFWRCAWQSTGLLGFTDNLVKVKAGSFVGLSIPRDQGRDSQKSSSLPRFSAWGKCRW